MFDCNGAVEVLFTRFSLVTFHTISFADELHYTDAIYRFLFTWDYIAVVFGVERLSTVRKVEPMLVFCAGFLVLSFAFQFQNAVKTIAAKSLCNNQYSL